MLSVCSSYAEEFSLIFNAKKSKYMVFKPLGDRSVDSFQRFILGGAEIGMVHEYSHLGNTLVDTLSDAECILMRCSQFIAQINYVLSTFRKQDKFVQIDLLHTFCCSFYGSVIWNLEAAEVLRLCST